MFTAWSGVRAAKQVGSICPQYWYSAEDVITWPWPLLRAMVAFLGAAPPISEDCLTVNIYTPTSDPSEVTAPKAVMVFYHGGGYREGKWVEEYTVHHIYNNRK